MVVVNHPRSLLACATLCLWLAGPLQAQPEQGPPPVPVVAARAEIRSLAPTSWVAGTVISRRDAQVAAEVQGRLVAVAEVGDRVAQGEVVAQLYDSLARLQVAEFEAAVKQVRARLGFLIRETQRLQRLATQNNAAQTLYEQTLADRDVAESELSVAEARLQQVNDQLARHLVRAPFDAIVLGRLHAPGEWVENGTAVVRLVDAEDREIQSWVPLTSRDFLASGDDVRVVADGVEVTAKVRSIVGASDQRSRLLEMRLSYSGADWLVGQTVRVAIPTALAQSMLAVPRDALVIRREDTALFRIAPDDTVERVSVQPGIADGAWVTINGDIHPGDRVVTRGGERLRPGQRVRVIAEGGE